MRKPKIAILGSNALMILGLKSLLEKMIPFADIFLYHDMVEMNADGVPDFYHYFISPEILSLDPCFFVRNRKITIIVIDQVHPSNIPNDFHQFNVHLPLHQLVKNLLLLEQSVHHGFNRFPKEMANELKVEEANRKEILTPREIDVLKGVAKGQTSKEISDNLHISLSTVLTHRKNIMEKVNSHSATKLVVYAVTHGYVLAEDIV